MAVGSDRMLVTITPCDSHLRTRPGSFRRRVARASRETKSSTAAENMPPNALQTSSELPELRLKGGEDRRISAGHLWVFSNEVDTARTPLQNFQAGEMCRV